MERRSILATNKELRRDKLLYSCPGFSEQQMKRSQYYLNASKLCGIQLWITKATTVARD